MECRLLKLAYGCYISFEFKKKIMLLYDIKVCENVINIYYGHRLSYSEICVPPKKNPAMSTCICYNLYRGSNLNCVELSIVIFLIKTFLSF